ncbi:type IX secretion system outer membrane channel protein PorV [Balneola vulgaris]|uniref:type IX secretion system outer membrane channel protein PorV n=1 Tax=Balneola vulgaris TaxID=287535 RepID=UPI00037386C5|nr:type IX secretion system outer membrane channel protein PorV [Balneola vulgaris]
MKKTLIGLAVALLVIFPATVFSQVGITGVPFLQIEPDSRGAGMGNTGVGIADNAAALFWNPAGLAFQRDNQASITHSNWLANFNVSDLFYDYVVVKQYVEGIGTIGAHLTYLNLGEQAQTGESPDVISRFNSYELALGLSYGTEVNKNLALGGSLRLIYSSLASGTTVSQQEVNPGSSVGVDIAMLYKSNPFDLGSSDAIASFGINLSNLGPGIQYSDNAQKDPIPTLLRFGPAINIGLDEDRINEITVAVDITKVMARKEAYEVQSGDSTVTEYRSVGPLKALVESWSTYKPIDPNSGQTTTVTLLQQFMIGAGMEYWYDKRFSLRGGYYYEDPNNGDREYITFGAGLRINKFGVDFSYIKTLESEHPLANTLRFSVLLNY